MTNIIKIYKKIHSNYETFLVTKNPDLLAANIDLYEKVDRVALRTSLATAPAHVVEQCNKSLLIIGKSYTEYALVMKESSPCREILQYLREAKVCYEMISRYTHSFPDSSLTPLLSNQLMEAIYRKKEIHFRGAEVSFHFAQQDTSSATPQLLKEIISAGKAFSALLKGSYKDKEIQQQLGLDRGFSCSVDDLVKNAISLLESLSNEQVYPSKRKQSERLSTQPSKEKPESITKKRRASDIEEDSSFSMPSTSTAIGLNKGDVTEDAANTQERPATTSSLPPVVGDGARFSERYPTRKSRILSRFLQFQPAPQVSVDGQEESFVPIHQV